VPFLFGGIQDQKIATRRLRYFDLPPVTNAVNTAAHCGSEPARDGVGMFNIVMA
jgi:hypothetical protein